MFKDKKTKVKDKTSGNKEKPSKALIFKRVIEVLLAVGIVAVFALAVFACSVIAKAPKIDTKDIEGLLAQSTVIYDADGNEIDTVYTDTDRSSVSYDEIPENLVHAFIALEDKTFEEHHGFNFIRIAGAVVEAVFGDGDISGTSTITQQLSRNLFLRDSRFERSMSRKIVEAYYSVILERELSKEEIIQAYLNTIDLGYHSSGVQAAAQAYFSKDVKDLSLAQCAALAPLAQQPSRFALVELVDNEDVSTEDENIIKRTPNGTFLANNLSDDRRRICLDLMADQGYISKEEAAEAKKIELKDMLDPSFTVPTGESAYFADYVISQVIDDLMDKYKWDFDRAWQAVYKGGLHIYSTLDSQAQGIIEKEFENEDHFPVVLTPTDGNDNIIRNGNIILYSYNNYFDEKGNFNLSADEAKKNKDGSLTLMADKRLNFYVTEVAGTTDYSVEFKNIYLYVDGRFNTISGGFINIPQAYKSMDKDGNIVVSKEFLESEDYADFFTFNDDGTISIPRTSYSLNQKVIQPQAAMTIIENSTGHIKAMVGGRMTSGRMLLNRAVSPRQPGSSMKPLGVYSAAIAQSAEEVANGQKHKFKDFNIDEQGDLLWGDYLTPKSIVIDEKTHINGKDWPANATRTFEGPVTMRRAMQLSINTCAVKILMQVGEDYSYDHVKKFGLTTLTDDDKNLAALALGGMSKGVTTLDMASAYSSFPNNGVRYDTKAYYKVTDQNDKELLSSEKPEKHKVMNPGVAWIMTDMLQSVVSNGSPAAISGVRAGGKTGTTDENNDIWFDGFTPNYSASLWIGNDQNLSLSSMSYLSARLWGIIMDQIDNAKVGSYPSAPDNVIYSGGDYFISGTQSGVVDINDLVVEAEVCEETGYLATPDCPHKEKKKFIDYSKFTNSDDEEEVDNERHKNALPKYYCNKHNSDPVKYPTNPKDDPVEPVLPPVEPENPEPENPENPEGPTEPETPVDPVEPPVDPAAPALLNNQNEDEDDA